MRRLMLLRHAKSDWSEPGMSDHDREINRRGRDTAPRIGAYMVRHGLMPDRVLCSTARRARVTWELVAAELGDAPPATFESRLYNAGPQAIVEVVRAIRDDARSLLVVGHNPGLQDLTDLLIASGDVDMRERLHEKFPTAGLVVIDFAIDSWSKLRPHAGRLDRFVVPRSLETATD